MSIVTNIFIAYSRKDEELLLEFRAHLTPIERSKGVNIWYDGQIEPGEEWENEIKKNLHNADFILLLISSDSIASEYFFNKEMKDALKRHELGTAKVIPLILRPCAWEATPLKKLQALPKDGKPVTSWQDRDIAFNDVVNNIWSLIQANQKRKPEQATPVEAELTHQILIEERPSPKASSKASGKNQLASLKKEDNVEKSWKSIILLLSLVLIGAFAAFSYFQADITAPRLPIKKPASTKKEAQNTDNKAIDATTTLASSSLKKLEGVAFSKGSVGEKIKLYLSFDSVIKGKKFTFSNLNFNTGSYKISSSSISEINNLAKVLIAYPNIHIEIGAHTDNTGNTAMNMELSALRAAAVKAKLMEMGIDASRITTKGYGSSVPVGDNATAAGKKANRRIEIEITKR